MNEISNQQLKTFLDIATEAVLASGGILEKYKGKVLDQIAQKEGKGNFVTQADQESEAVLIEVLQRHLPEHSILAEESGALKGNSDRFLWAIDPLDGTVNYAHNYPLACVCAGLLIDGIPQVGAIYDPFSEKLYRAARGLGATCNRKPIKVSTTGKLRDSLLVTGFAYDRQTTTDNNYAEFCYLTHLTQGVRRGGSAGLDMAHLASGYLDGYWERAIQPWDVVAGIVLVEEAGGKVTGYDGKPLSLEKLRILATNNLIHEELQEALGNTPPIETWSDGEKMATLGER